MKVSVCMITYGHEAFITQAIESVLDQECSFDFELVIMNDCSKDGTDEVVNRIIHTHPRGNLIRYYRQETNIGVIRNFIAALQQCTGTYIAICEGDDYWIDKNKLQTQVDFLDGHPDFSLSFHSIYELADNKLELVTADYQSGDGVFTIEQLAKEGNFVPTLSVVFRNNIANLPEWFSTCPLPDLALNMINGTYGKFKGFNMPMGVYRKHEGGVYSMKPVDQKVNALIKTLSILSENLDPSVAGILKTHRDGIFEHLIRYFYYEKDCDKAEHYIAEAIALNPQISHTIATEILPLIIRGMYHSNRYKIGDKIANVLNFIKRK